LPGTRHSGTLAADEEEEAAAAAAAEAVEAAEEAEAAPTAGKGHAAVTFAASAAVGEDEAVEGVTGLSSKADIS
jgi:hypothetical protein